MSKITKNICCSHRLCNWNAFQVNCTKIGSHVYKTDILLGQFIMNYLSTYLRSGVQYEQQGLSCSEEKNASSQPLQSKVACAPRKNGKISSTWQNLSDRRMVSHYRWLIIWSISCVCLPVSTVVHIHMIWHFPFEHTWQLRQHSAPPFKHTVTMTKGGASLINNP